MKKSVIIIGAGPGGLAAAMLLARQGYQVDVYEQKPQVGGRNGSLKVGDYTFDIGPTFFIYPPILEEVFEKSGLSIKKYVPLKPLDPLYTLYFPQGSMQPSPDYDKTIQEIKRLFPGDEIGYKAYLTYGEKRLKALTPLLKLPFFHPGHFIRSSVLKAIPYLEIRKSLYDHLGKFFKHEQMIHAMAFQAKYLGMSMWEAPSMFSILSYMEHAYGIHTVKGGLNQVAAQMQKAAEDLGARFHFDATITGVTTVDNKVTGITLSTGVQHFADAVVMNADFATGIQLLPERLRPAFINAKLAKKEYSCSTFMIYLGLDKTYPNLTYHSILFARDYPRNVEETTKTLILSDDPSVYVHYPAAQDSSMAPEGHSTLYLLAPVPNLRANIDWKATHDGYVKKIIALVEDRLGIDITSHIQAMKTITPEQWRDEYGVYEGAVFNLSHKLSQMLLFRPHNKFSPAKGFYLVGGGTQPGSGLPTIYQSALITAEQVIKDFNR